MLDLTKEITVQTTRSGGKGGQHVNKVETAAIASFDIGASQLLSPEQKELIREKLANRISGEGLLQVRSQTHRAQLANREEAIGRINKLINTALLKKKPRIATKASRQSKEKRLDSKKKLAELKSGRKKLRAGDY